MAEAPRTNDLTPQEFDLWKAVYLDTLQWKRSTGSYLPGLDAEEAAREAVLHLRKMSLAAVEQPPKEAANG